MEPKSITKFVFVSKHWSSIVRNKVFIDLYLTQSATRKRLLFSVYRPDTQFFHSCSQEEPFSDHHKLSIITPARYEFFSPPIRGLICSQIDTKVLIGNPSTGQFITLPKVKTRRLGIYAFFGYEPVSDQYKVLCMTVKNIDRPRGLRVVVSEEHQVFTLGAREKTWRMIECKIPHFPPFSGTKRICINGVVYYYARVNKKCSLISFDLRCEEFSVVKLPEDISLLASANLVSYSGKVALIDQPRHDTLKLRVLEDSSKHEWSKVSVFLPF